MIRAAGMCFVTPDDKVLLMHRTGEATEDGDIRGCWAFPGGGMEGEETAEEAARREIQEETGLEHEGPVKLWTRRIQGADFTTFLAPIAEPFVPTLNDEHDAYHWVDRRFALTSPDLHPGVYVALRRFEMDELGVAKAIRDGELTSPQRYGNLLLIAIRITGTGHSFRQALDEHVWRDPSIYMNPEFLERCNGLPVIAEHPKSNMLDTKEFRDRIVGTVFVPYQKEAEQETWAIAKIFDMDAADVLETEELSTSPAVVFMNMSAGDRFPMNDGNTLLIENKPSLLDHVAICPLGIWDKGGPPTGIVSIDAKADSIDPMDLIVRNIQLNEICQRIQ